MIIKATKKVIGIARHAVFVVGAAALLGGNAFALTNGKWSASISCGPREDVSPVRPAFKSDLPQFSVSKQQFTLPRTYKEPKNTVTEEWRGQVSGGNLVITAKSQRDNGNVWAYELRAPNTNAGAIQLQGEMLDDTGKHIRTCTMSLALVEAEATPAPAPVVAARAKQPAPSAVSTPTPAQLASVKPVPVATATQTAPATPPAAVKPAATLTPAPTAPAERKPEPVGKASFDCSKASSAQEKTICASPSLSALDIKLAEIYKTAQSATGDAAKLKAEQVAWLKETRACGGDIACLERSYNARINELAAKPAPIAAPVVPTASVAAVEAPVPTTPVASEAAPIASEPTKSQSSEPVPTSPQASSVEEKVVPIWEDKYVKLGGGVVFALALLGLAYWLIKKITIGLKKGAAAAAKKGAEIKKDVTEKSAQAKEMMAEKANQAREAMTEKTALLASELAAKTKETAAVASTKILSGNSETTKNDSFNDSKEKLFNFAKNVKNFSSKLTEDLRSDETKAKIKDFANQAQSFASEKTKNLKDELNKINEARKETANEAKDFESTSKIETSKVAAFSFWSKLSSKQKLIIIGFPLLLFVCFMALFDNKYTVKDAGAELSRHQLEVCKYQATFLNFENKRRNREFSSLEESNAFVRKGVDRYIAHEKEFFKSPVFSWAKKSEKNTAYLQCMMSKDNLPCDTLQRPMPNLNQVTNACNGLFLDIAAIELH